MAKRIVFFCATLEDAFARARLPYSESYFEPGKLRRFPTSANRNDQAGWVKVFPDGKGALFGCHRAGIEFVWQQRDANAPQPTKAERQASRARAALSRKEAERTRTAEHAKGAESAVTLLAQTIGLAEEHDYVVREGIAPYGARQDRNGAIVLPVQGPDGQLQSLQFIEKDGRKRFLSQGKMKGGRLFLGLPVNGSPLTLVEGWATGCSVHEATNDAVVVCFSGSNMDDVAADLRREYPDSPLRVAGDRDAHGMGLKYAQEAATAAWPATVLLPSFQDGRDAGDFNDLAQAEGVEEVYRQLAAVPDEPSSPVVRFVPPAFPAADARDGTSDSRPLTELGNAQRLFDAHADLLHYVHEMKTWIIWQDGAWHWDPGGAAVRSLAAGLPSIIYNEGGRHLEDVNHFGKWARKSQELKTISNAVVLLSDSDRIRLPLPSLDADPYLVGLDGAKQVVDLRTGVQRAAMQSDYVTKALRPERIGDPAQAVRWIEFLDQVFVGDQELIDWLQRFGGYLLTGSTQEHLFLFCFGHGANGKSVFVELLRYIMGDYGRAIASETLSESKRQAGGATPDLAALIGARLVMSGETEDNTAMAESLVKSLVSGDSMAVRPLYCAPIQFTPNFKLIMCGNHKPIVRGNDNGIWRRVRLVPFTRTFAPDERDPGLLDKLKAEAPHILAWMIAGCESWLKRGLTDTPRAIASATAEYQQDQDIVGRWLEECTALSVHAETAKADMYASYKNWCIENGLRPASDITLSRRLSERGLKDRKSHGTRLWVGVTLTTAQHFTPDDYLRATNGY
jgi:P4 family phage/plasmid primase-like protien